jgi:hypothetical protein
MTPEASDPFFALRRPFRRAIGRFAKRLRGMRRRLAKRLLVLRYHSLWYGGPIDIPTIGVKHGRLRYPDFIIIGAPKCGTSWLQGVLSQHPNIVMVPDEIEYFSAHLERYPLDWYVHHFTQCLASAAATKPKIDVIGEKSARYCSITLDRIRVIHRLLPDARLILMTRDPVARHWSHAKRYFSKQRINSHKDGVLAVPQSTLFDFLTSTRPLGEFSTMIANWTAVYPREQLLIVSQEKTLARPLETYAAVLAHIDVASDYDPASIRFLSEQKNRGPRIEMPDDVAELLEGMFASERRHLRELLGERAFTYSLGNSVKRSLIG